MKLWHNLCHQSLRLISFATSLYTREAFAARWPQIVPRNKLIFPVNHCLISPILMQNQPIFLQYCKFSIKKSEILTFHMQKRLHFAVLVKGLFSPAKNSFPSAPLTELKLRAFRPHRSNRGAGPKFLSRPHRAIWGSAPAGTCLPPAP